MWKLAIGAVALVCAGSVSAQTIRFDEFPADDVNGAITSNRYAALGVTFSGTTDGATRGGNSNGNPGNWSLQGTNGAVFSGFNGLGGSGYTQTLTFASAISFFSLDASRANGSRDGTILLQGFFNNALVSQNSVVLGAINSWSSVSVSGTFDSIIYSGSGSGFHPYGIDNLVFRPAAATGAVPEPSTWAMLLVGFGVVGAGMRRRQSVRVRFA